MAQISGEKIFASLSSGDIEFAPLLKHCSYSADSPLNTLRLDIHNSNIQVLYGGFPINFARATNDPISNDINSTRALTFLSILQAAQMLNHNMLFPLDRSYEEFLMGPKR